MDIIRDESQELQFGPFCATHDLVLRGPFLDSATPLAQRDILRDVHMKLYGSPRCFQSNSLGLCPDDLHVFFLLNDDHPVDLTTSVIDELAQHLANHNPAQAHAEYHSALQQWLATARRFSVSLGIDVAEQEVAVEAMLRRPPRDWLEQLGDSTVGWRGNVHVFNFLYKAISIAPISLRAILSNHGIDVPQGSRALLRFSIAETVEAAGSLSLAFRYQHVNPVDGQIGEIENRVRSLETRVTSVEGRVNMLEGRMNAVERRVSNAESRIRNNESRLSAHERRLNMCEYRLEQIDTSLSTVESDIANLYEYIPPFSPAKSTVCVSIDSSTDDNGALACNRVAFPGHGLHDDLADLGATMLAFPQSGSLPKVGFICGHGNHGIISTGGGQNIEPGKFIGQYNAYEWEPVLREWRGQIHALSLRACSPGAEEGGARLLHMIAQVVGCYVTAPTGLMFCSGGNITFEAGTEWQIACGAKKPEAIPAPSTKFLEALDMKEIVLQDGIEKQVKPLESVEELQVFRTAPQMGAAANPIVTLNAVEAQRVAKTIHFDNPQEFPAGVMAMRTAVLRFVIDGQLRTFHVYNNSLLQDDAERETYYYASTEFENWIAEVLGPSGPRFQ